jgi:hypothetical protein
MPKYYTRSRGKYHGFFPFRFASRRRQFACQSRALRLANGGSTVCTTYSAHAPIHSSRRSLSLAAELQSNDLAPSALARASLAGRKIDFIRA